jgi:hypothetical protein
LAVLATPDDPAWPALRSAWNGPTVRLSSRDLSRPGWRLAVNAPADARLATEDGVLEARSLAAIVVRLGWIHAWELCWIDEAEREYVAAEMNAFLLAFLHLAPCLVMNRPTALCLAGPMWRPAAWRAAAANMGLTPASALETATWRIDVVGRRAAGPATRSTLASSAALAGAANADLLCLEMTGEPQAPRFVTAHPFPDLANPDLAAAAVATVRALE